MDCVCNYSNAASCIIFGWSHKGSSIKRTFLSDKAYRRGECALGLGLAHLLLFSIPHYYLICAENSNVLETNCRLSSEGKILLGQIAHKQVLLYSLDVAHDADSSISTFVFKAKQWSDGERKRNSLVCVCAVDRIERSIFTLVFVRC